MSGLHSRFAQNGIRAATEHDADAIAAVNVACWRDAYREILDPAILAARSVEESAERWRTLLRRRALEATVLVVEEAGRVIAFGSGSSQRDPYLSAIGYSGEIATLYVHPEEQGRGIGSRLMAALARGLIAAGHASASVWVLERNGIGRRFYESLKGRLLLVHHELPRLGHAVEVAYAWPVLRTLCPRAIASSPSTPS